jgi:glycine reductase|tara:strand:+ start:1474 stop:1698 length:225 start_codon:yes stop_codon:yes gene_type:complete
MMTAMPAIPLSVGANRIVRGVRVPHVCGDPALSEDRDRELSERIVRTALGALATRVTEPTLFEPSQSAPQAVTA